MYSFRLRGGQAYLKWWFTLQLPATVGRGPNQSWKLGIQYMSLLDNRERSQVFQHHLLPPTVSISRKEECGLKTHKGTVI